MYGILAGINKVPMAPDASALAEELNLAYGMHEAEGEVSESVMDWLVENTTA